MACFYQSSFIFLTLSLCFFLSGVFPEPNKDPVIQIANMVIRQGDSDPFIRNVFTLKLCAPVVGSKVLSYDTEFELLQVSEVCHCCHGSQATFVTAVMALRLRLSLLSWLSLYVCHGSQATFVTAVMALRLHLSRLSGHDCHCCHGSRATFVTAVMALRLRLSWLECFFLGVLCSL